MPTYANIYFSNHSNTHIFFLTIEFLSPSVFEFWSFNILTGSLTKILSNKSITNIVSFGNKIFFSAQDRPSFQNSIWSSDGTIGGTEIVKDFGSNNLQSLFKYGDKLVFTSSGSTWISDGTEIGTTFLTSGNTYAFSVIDNYFYGLGFDFNTNFTKLFKTDGVTVDIATINGDLTTLSMYGAIPKIDNRLILQYYNAAVGTELGISDEAKQDLTLLKDINPGLPSSRPRAWTTLNEKVIFIADDGVNGAELWSTDGTSSGTVLLKNVVEGTANAFPYFQLPGPSLAVGNEKLHVLAATSPAHYDLLVSDGTTLGTSVKFDFGDVLRPILFGKTATDLIYFTPGKFYKTNDSQNVSLFKDISSGLFGLDIPFQKPYALKNNLLFTLGVSYAGGSTGNEFWVTDGTDAGTHILKDINPGSGSGITGVADTLNSKLIFTGYTPESGNELWITDATETGTVLLKDINSGSGESLPTFITNFNNKIIFSAFEPIHGREPWVSDGTAEGTLLLIDLVSGTESSEAGNFTRIANELLFTAFDLEKGWCLWKTNGTAEGTVFVKDIEPGNDKANTPSNFVSVGDKVYFTANDNEHGVELWFTDGTPLGTKGLDLVSGSLGSKPTLLTPINDLLYFKSQSALWLTNGTITGTIKIFDYEPFEIVNMGNTIYFTAFHPDYGIELFKYEFKKIDQQIVFSEIGVKTIGDSDFMINAEATSGLPIIITSENELSISNRTASIVKAGTVKVIIQQLGDELFNPATQIDQTFCIYPAKPIITESEDTGSITLVSSSNDGNQWYKDGSIIMETQNIFKPAESGSYSVNVTIEDCASERSNEHVIIITAIEGTDSALEIFPNPAQESVYIKHHIGNATVNIIDQQGKRVFNLNLQGAGVTECSISHLSKGLYVIQVIEGDKITFNKLIKE
jgi:ELWxxDGT repeat protein